MDRKAAHIMSVLSFLGLLDVGREYLAGIERDPRVAATKRSRPICWGEEGGEERMWTTLGLRRLSERVLIFNFLKVNFQFSCSEHVIVSFKIHIFFLMNFYNQ